jgi:hypothetical protein
LQSDEFKNEMGVAFILGDLRQGHSTNVKTAISNSLRRCGALNDRNFQSVVSRNQSVNEPLGGGAVIAT